MLILMGSLGVAASGVVVAAAWTLPNIIANLRTLRHYQYLE